MCCVSPCWKQVGHEKRMSGDVKGATQTSSLKLLTAVQDEELKTHQRTSQLNTACFSKVYKDVHGSTRCPFNSTHFYKITV